MASCTHLTLLLLVCCRYASSQAPVANSSVTSRNSSNDVGSMVALLDWAGSQGVHLPRWSKATDPCGASDCCSLPLSNQLSSVPCNWSGICCDEWSVTVLDLSCGKEVCEQQLKGSLPVDALSQLHSLSYLNISGHMLDSGLERMNWTHLHHLLTLDMSWNNFASVLPWAGGFEQLPLEGLYLHNNQFQGPLPSAWSELIRLQTLRLASNQLYGQIPPEWSSLSLLRLLDLSGNCGLCGIIPNLAAGAVLIRQGTALGYTCSSALCVSRDWRPLIIGIGISAACAVVLSLIYVLRVRFLRSNPLFGSLIDPQMERASQRSSSRLMDASERAARQQSSRHKLRHQYGIIMLRLTVCTETCTAHVEMVRDKRSKRNHHHHRHHHHNRSQQHRQLNSTTDTQQQPPLPYNAIADAWALSVTPQLLAPAAFPPHEPPAESSQHSASTTTSQQPHELDSLNQLHEVDRVHEPQDTDRLDIEAGLGTGGGSNTAEGAISASHIHSWGTLQPAEQHASREQPPHAPTMVLGQPVNQGSVVEGTVIVQLHEDNTQQQQQLGQDTMQQQEQQGWNDHVMHVDSTWHAVPAQRVDHSISQQQQQQTNAAAAPSMRGSQRSVSLRDRLIQSPYNFLHRILRRSVRTPHTDTDTSLPVVSGSHLQLPHGAGSTATSPRPQQHSVAEATSTGHQGNTIMHQDAAFRGLQLTELTPSSVPTAHQEGVHHRYGSADIQLDKGGTLPCLLPGVDLIVLSPDLQVVDFAVREDIHTTIQGKYMAVVDTATMQPTQMIQPGV